MSQSLLMRLLSDAQRVKGGEWWRYTINIFCVFLPALRTIEASVCVVGKVPYVLTMPPQSYTHTDGCSKEKYS